MAAMPVMGVAGMALGLASGEIVAFAVLVPMLAIGLTGPGFGRHMLSCQALTVACASAGVLVGHVLVSVIDSARPAGLLAVIAAWSFIVGVPTLYVIVPAERRRQFVALVSATRVRAQR